MYMYGATGSYVHKFVLDSHCVFIHVKGIQHIIFFLIFVATKFFSRMYMYLSMLLI